MSTEAIPTYFFVYAPDKTDEGAFERRLAVRAEHAAGVAANREAGLIKFGGALANPESLTGGPKKLVGSTLFIRADTIEEAKKLIEEDVYYKTGVWDPENLVILPFLAPKVL
ncbi:hypothetical protein SISSUDRAFT_990778 [Sistotremastrum suecicum HHB10207 ss-3]|uniref:YCII-related domain-containing protein n=1 Tax=Sistotremastrum suecicum HHB10207 ss-3 TaxID=1314776 RepID=A0A166AF68_9AGAM|nr:hypothetical protein SISSUDRAFT_990778 [Sistotremastrum suecicum HHB10207 ss-3]